MTCPTCGSPYPSPWSVGHGHGGTVPCPDPFHKLNPASEGDSQERLQVDPITNEEIEQVEELKRECELQWEAANAYAEERDEARERASRLEKALEDARNILDEAKETEWYSLAEDLRPPVYALADCLDRALSPNTEKAE
jgi:hypothetical protein